ncbi:MAG: hypothetical protein V7637_4534, partial [Mycobacteriales bacterium]
MSAYPADPPLRSPLAGARCDAHSGGRLMTEDDTDIRTLLATLTEELPPTRLTADHLVTA